MRHLSSELYQNHGHTHAHTHRRTHTDVHTHLKLTMDRMYTQVGTPLKHIVLELGTAYKMCHLIEAAKR